MTIETIRLLAVALLFISFGLLVLSGFVLAGYSDAFIKRPGKRTSHRSGHDRVRR